MELEKIYVVEISDLTDCGVVHRSNGRLRLFRRKSNVPCYKDFAGRLLV